jgi:hypothetical protein
MGKSKLKGYGDLKVNNISIVYDGEKIRFNLFEEVSINENRLDQEIKSQPSLYAFLILIQKKLNTRFEGLKQERKKLYGQLFLRAKQRSHAGRPYNDEMAKAWVESHKKYVTITSNCIKAKDEADVLYAAVRAFEQRKDLIQTLSSNNRKFS